MSDGVYEHERLGNQECHQLRLRRLQVYPRGADDLSPTLYQDVLDKLQAGGKTADEIAEELMEETDAFPAHVFFILKKFEKAGLFLEPYETEEEK